MSLPLTMRFYLTHDDMLNAYNAQLDDLCKPGLRKFLSVLGFLAVIVPPLLFLFRLKAKLDFFDLFFFIAGAIIIRAWIIAPYIKRHKMMKSNDPPQMIVMTIDENAITHELQNGPLDTIEWSEIDRISETTNGVMIYHHSTQWIWIPIRAFEGPTGLDEFLNLTGRMDKF